MRESGLQSKYRRPRAKNAHTMKQGDKETRLIHENLIARIVHERSYVGQANKIWCADFTQMGSRDGKVYVCGAIDIGSRKIVGYSFGSIENSTNVTRMLENALQKHTRPEIFHSDRGPGFVSVRTKEFLDDAKIDGSMSAPHRPNQNQFIETFGKTMKTEIGRTKEMGAREFCVTGMYYINWHNIAIL